MNNQKNIIAIILIVVTVILATVVFIVIKRNSDRASQNSQKEEIVSAETLRKQAEKEGKRDLELIKKGYVKMLTGEIVEADNDAKSFVIDINPLRKHEKYTIYANEKTKFSILTHIYEGSADENTSGIDDEINTSEKYSPADFSYIAKSSQVIVTLNKWAEDINNSGQRLVAEKIDIMVE